MTLNDVQMTAKRLLPDLAGLCWSKRQAILQERDAAGAEKRRWQLVVIVLEERIAEQERKITRRMDVLKFEVKGMVS